MDPLDHPGALEIKNGLADFLTVRAGEDQLRFAGTGHPDFTVLIHIPVGMSRQRDRLLPRSHDRLDPVHQDRLAKHRAVKRGPDRPVRALIHLLELILLHPRRIRRDRRALHRHAVLLRRLRRLKRHAVIRLIPVRKPQVIILRLQIHIRQQQLLLDPFPENPCHLIAVHLNKRCRHTNLIHLISSFTKHGTVPRSPLRSWEACGASPETSRPGEKHHRSLFRGRSSTNGTKSLGNPCHDITLHRSKARKHPPFHYLFTPTSAILNAVSRRKGDFSWLHCF